MRAHSGQPPAGQRYEGLAVGDTGRKQQGKAERDAATMGKGCLQRSILQSEEHIPAFLYTQGVWELRSKRRHSRERGQVLKPLGGGGTCQELCGTCTAMWVPLAVASNATC